MKAREIERFRLKLEAFLADVILPMGHKERGQHAEEYIRGLLMDGEHKSIEPMANRLPDGDVQALQQLVNQSPWPSVEGRASLARKVAREFVPEAYWLIVGLSCEDDGQEGFGVPLKLGEGVKFLEDIEMDEGSLVDNESHLHFLAEDEFLDLSSDGSGEHCP